MTSDEAVLLTRRHVERQFPKVCSKCGARYATLADYLRQTRHVGTPISYDADMDDWHPEESGGTMSLANCSCGSTIAISSAGMGLATLWRLLGWARRETKRRQITLGEVLAWVRDEIDRQVLAELAGDRPRE